MTTAADTQLYIEQHLKAAAWHILQTLALGLLAAGFALFGQECLEGARPLFPLIDQNFVLWQASYVLVLLVIGLIWFSVLLRNIHLRQDYKRHLRAHLQREEIKAEREAKALAAKLEKLAALEALNAANDPPPRPKTGHSNKFDY